MYILEYNVSLKVTRLLYSSAYWRSCFWVRVN